MEGTELRYAARCGVCRPPVDYAEQETKGVEGVVQRMMEVRSGAVHAHGRYRHAVA